MKSAKSELENLFMRKKPVELVVALNTGKKSKYVSTLAKETDCTYSHTVKLLNTFKAMGLVKFDKMGRVKFVALTQEGKDLAEKMQDVLRKFSKIPMQESKTKTRKTAKKRGKK
jgi:DNA-binding MarR family transcriptional regulator